MKINFNLREDQTLCLSLCIRMVTAYLMVRRRNVCFILSHLQNGDRIFTIGTFEVLNKSIKHNRIRKKSVENTVKKF